MMGGRRFEEVVIVCGGVVRLVLVYIPIARKYLKIFPNNSDNNSDHQPEIVVFEEKRAREIMENYEKLHNATVIVQQFRGFRDYNKVRVNSSDIKLNELFNGQKVCITA